MREGTTFSYFLTDNLGLRSVHTRAIFLPWFHQGARGAVVGVADSSGTLVSETRYLPFGETRTDVGLVTQTDFGYTFQRGLTGTGLMDYKARFYDPSLGRFIQPDTLVSTMESSQALNRYTYVTNNPINYNDPTGYAMCDDMGNCYLNPGERMPTQNQNLPTISVHYIPKTNTIGSQTAITTSSGKLSKSCTVSQTAKNMGNNSTINKNDGLTIGEDNTVPFWDTNPHDPDYYSATINGGEIFGGGVIVIVDRYGNTFGGISFNFGKSLTPVSGTLVGGWIGNPFDNHYPSVAESEEYLQGLSVNAGAGVLGGGNVGYNPINGYYPNHFSFETGVILIAELGISLNLTGELPVKIR